MELFKAIVTGQSNLGSTATDFTTCIPVDYMFLFSLNFVHGMKPDYATVRLVFQLLVNKILN